MLALMDVNIMHYFITLPVNYMILLINKENNS